MKEKEIKNTIVDEENNPYTVKAKIDVLGILKNMELEEQEQLIGWIIEKINERTKITMTNDKIATNFRGLNQVTTTKDSIKAESKGDGYMNSDFRIENKIGKSTLIIENGQIIVKID